jgi:hypothetical protein
MSLLLNDFNFLMQNLIYGSPLNNTKYLTILRRRKTNFISAKTSNELGGDVEPNRI